MQNRWDGRAEAGRRQGLAAIEDVHSRMLVNTLLPAGKVSVQEFKEMERLMLPEDELPLRWRKKRIPRNAPSVVEVEEP